MEQLRAVLFAALATAVAGCMVDASEPYEGRLEWIAGGAPETAEPQTVVVYNRRGGLCTGSIIAPRVVLTAKHCVQQEGASAPDDPSYFIVGVGNSVRSLTESLTVSRIRTTPGVYTSGSGGLGGALVGVDIAVMTLTRGITAFDPYPIRREAPNALVGREALNIGFGQTPSGQTGTKYKATTLVRGVMGGVIYTNPNTCQGDSGGPMIDPETYEVFGITSFGSGACGSGIAGFNRIDLFLDLIDEAIGDSGGCLNDGAERCDGFDNDCDGEIDEGCVDIGGACGFSEECIGNNCADTPGGRICTIECDPLRPTLSCPPGLYCARTEGCSGLCVPGAAGTLGNDADCTADTDCDSLFCADPGDGRRRCLTACRGDAGMCLAGEVCAAGGGSCNGCVDEHIVVGSRGLGEPCGSDDACGSRICLEESGTAYCTRVCGTDSDCGDGFHCRESDRGMVCIRGSREGVGGGCVGNGDCEDGLICAARDDVRWCTSFCTDGDPASCPERFTCVPAGGASVCAPDGGLVGEACETSADCISGLCGAGTCTRLCGPDAPCSTGFECVRTADGRDAVCLAPAVVGGGGDEGGCGCRMVQPRGGAGGFWALLGLGAFALISRRRRR